MRMATGSIRTLVYDCLYDIKSEEKDDHKCDNTHGKSFSCTDRYEQKQMPQLHRIPKRHQPPSPVSQKSSLPPPLTRIPQNHEYSTQFVPRMMSQQFKIPQQPQNYFQNQIPQLHQIPKKHQMHQLPPVCQKSSMPPALIRIPQNTCNSLRSQRPFLKKCTRNGYIYNIL